jgi:hypothetical protein
MARASFTCAHATGWFAEYVAGRLGLTELALVEMHLAQCASCRQALQELASETAQPPPPRIRHRRWRPGRLIAPAAATAARAIARVVASRPRSSGSVRTALAAIRIGAPSVPSVPSWLRRPHWRPSLHHPPGALNSLVRIGSLLVALSLVGGIWWLPAPDGSVAPMPLPRAPASAGAPQPAPTVTTTQAGVSTEVAPPAPLVPARPPSSSRTQLPDKRGAPSPAPASVIPPPEWNPEGKARPDSSTGSRAPTPEEVQPAPSSPDPAAAVDWLLRGDGRGTRSRSRAETP